jgi:hypothetical protein
MRLAMLLLIGAGLFAAEQVPAVGTTWKFRSEKVLEGNPPASALNVTPGKIWTVPPVNTNPPRNARPAEPGFVVKFTVSADGRELTWEGQGTDAKGKMFRFVQIWDKQ